MIQIHSTHNIRKDDDEKPYCVRCAAYTDSELEEECLDSDPLLDIWNDDDEEFDDDDELDDVDEDRRFGQPHYGHDNNG